MGRPLFHPCPNRPQLISLDWMMVAQSLLEPANIESSCIHMDLIKSNVDQLAYLEGEKIGHHRHAVITDSVSSFTSGLQKSLHLSLCHQFSGFTNNARAFITKPSL